MHRNETNPNKAEQSYRRASKFLDELSKGSGKDTGSSSTIKATEKSTIKAIRGLTFLMNANDDAIDDLFDLIANWEEITGTPFTASSEVQPTPEPAPEPVLSLAEKAQSIIDEQDWHYKVMPPELRHATYIRVLIVLLIEALSGKLVASKSICIASGAPGTTALRYLDKLVEHGLIERVGLPSDGRVRLIQLTSEGHELAEMLVGHAVETRSR